MAIIQALRKIGQSPAFYNIDYFRYSNTEIESHFRDNQYDVVGISAVVSTAYAYTKYLSQVIRRVSPQTVIVVGGNLAASAEILLNRCAVNFCVVGDGEIIVQKLISALRENPADFARLRTIKGICSLDENGNFCFSGYGQRPSAEEIESPDYSILEEDGSLEYFIPEAGHRGDASLNATSYFDGVSKRLATVVMAKGCVSRCTFCHRFEKGYRARPVEQLAEHMRTLKDKYKIEFIDIADENFGSDREQSQQVADTLRELGMTWRAAGVRVRTVDLESLRHWKSCGCIAVEYGIESGSPRMLRVMEKNATLEENIRALKYTHEAGLTTVIQLVIGMPGETDETVEETIRFLKNVHPYMDKWNKSSFPSDSISINYAQALPGTPLYQYARERGFIGKTIDGEERYLLKISDTDAYREDHFINYTGQPLLKVLMWRPLILAELDAYHLRKLRVDVRLSLTDLVRYYSGLIANRLANRQGFGARLLRPLFESLSADSEALDGRAAASTRKHDYYSDSGYFNIQSGLKYAPLKFNPLTSRLFYLFVAFAVAMRNGPTLTSKVWLLVEHLFWSVSGHFKPRKLDLPDQSLRKLVVTVTRRNEDAVDRMMPLRSGR